MEEMDFTALLAQYSGKGKSGFNPIMKYGVLTYAAMRGVREIDRILNCANEIWLSFGSPRVNNPKEMLFMILSIKNLQVKS